MNYEIISTGSKGNCVVIGDVMIDVGVAFKYIKNHLYDVKTILLTHIHSDHIKESTLKQIVMMFPRITIYGNYEVCQTFREYPIKVINENVPFEQAGKVFTPFRCVHDVLTYGYTWTDMGQDIIYATDTSNLSNAPAGKYDYLFIESNHDERKIETLLDQRKFGYDAYGGAKRHLSTQAAKAFYYMNRKSPKSEFVELHQSSRFY